MNYFIEPFLDYIVSEVPKRNIYIYIYIISSGEPGIIGRRGKRPV